MPMLYVFMVVVTLTTVIKLIQTLDKADEVLSPLNEALSIICCPRNIL